LLNDILNFWKVKLIYKQYLGIYINESEIQYTGYYKFFPGLFSGKKGLFKSSLPKVFNDSSFRFNLKKLLDSIKPSKRRKIYICLPRKFFFTRRLKFPVLPLDDVRDSVVNNLEIYSHLPLDEIYYDVLFSKDKGSEINALLFYAPRKKLDIYLNQLMETGHYNSLECIFPFSYGAGPWYFGLKTKPGDQKGLVIQYKDSTEIALYSGYSCIDSFLLDTYSEKENQDKIIKDIMAEHDMSENQIAYKNTNTVTQNNFLNENMGGAALSPVFSGMQQISVDENLPRIKLFKPMKLLFPLFIILGALMSYLSMNILDELEVKQKNLEGVKKEIIALEKEIDPILQAKTALERAAEYKGDVEDFVLSKPPLYSYLNDLALNVPENTWFAHLSYKPGIISMQGEGDDVLKVVEFLRMSDKYKEVKLKGSVSRTKEGKDKFMIDLILKDLEKKSR
jgi:hypothetical protein